MSAPKTTRAIVIKSPGQAVIEEVPTPRLRDEYILIKTKAVALYVICSSGDVSFFEPPQTHNSPGYQPAWFRYPVVY